MNRKGMKINDLNFGDVYATPKIFIRLCGNPEFSCTFVH